METWYRCRAYIVIFFGTFLLPNLYASGLGGNSCRSVVQDGKEVPQKTKYRVDKNRSFGKPGKESHPVQRRYCETDTTMESSSMFPGQPHDCADIKASGVNTSGIYGIYPGGVGRPFNVFCDMDTDGGGWTVFQRRMDGSVRFGRNWSEFKIGFGSVSSEHWLGNDKIHRLTNQKTYELRVDLEDFEGETKYAIYNRFNVGNESDKYKLKIGSLINGTAGNSFGEHSGSAFSTVDRDHDGSSIRHCANNYQSGWWFKHCYCCNLNGRYYHNPTAYKNGGVIWEAWHGYRYSLKGTEMKIRPVKP